MTSINSHSSTLFQLAKENNFVLKLSAGGRRFESLVSAINHREFKVVMPKNIPQELAPHSVLKNVVLHSVCHELDVHLNVRVLSQEVREHGGLHLKFQPDDDMSRAELWKLLISIRSGDLSKVHIREKPLERPTKIPGRGLYTEDARLNRLAFIRERSASPLHSLAQTRLEPEKLTGNIENLVGSVEVPVGLAGPLQFWGENVSEPILRPWRRRKALWLPRLREGRQL